jgi:uncharacterized membrane protein YkvA (DUF1232 family)
MSNPNPTPEQKVNLVVSVINRLRLVARLFMDPRVPIYLKLVPIASLAYALMPIDLIPDVIPVLGQLDDLGVVILAVEAFVMMAPQDVVHEHMAAMENESRNNRSKADETIIDGEWRTVHRDR